MAIKQMVRNYECVLLFAGLGLFQLYEIKELALCPYSISLQPFAGSFLV